jgi:repressor LexA
MVEHLTDAQRRIVRVVERMERAGEPAFVPDLVQSLGLAAESSITPTLRLLERHGVVSVHGGGSRGRSRVVRLTARARYGMGLGGLPLLGTIPAGPLSEALANPETLIDDHELLSYREGDFLLLVHGDSMTGDGILNGDKVLLRPTTDIRPGEIAAVLVGDAHEATLKHVFFEAKGKKIILRASNPAYPDLTVPAADVKIAGVFRGLVRGVA